HVAGWNEEVVRTAKYSSRLRPFPILVEIGVHERRALCGLDVTVILAGASNLLPIDVPLKMRYIDAIGDGSHQTTKRQNHPFSLGPFDGRQRFRCGAGYLQFSLCVLHIDLKVD